MQKMPVVMKVRQSSNKIEGFPLEHYSQSSWVKFSSNPYMFKVNNINGDRIDTTSSPMSVLGKAVHKALERYFGGNKDIPTSNEESEAIKEGHQTGLDYLKNYSDGFIEWGTTIPDRAKLEEKYAFCYFGYLKEFLPKADIKQVLMVEKMLEHTVSIDGKELPIPLKGAADLVYEDSNGDVVIWDHKMTRSWSDEDEIDGAKLVQAAFLFFLTYAETGREPKKIVFAEFKVSENRDKSQGQLQVYEIVYRETPLIFELFARLYKDITDALMGKQVFIPNLLAMFDREISILAYIHNLDIPDSQSEQFKKMKVDNITDFLKKKIQKSGSMKKYLDVVSKKFISAQTLNYKDMTKPERIKMKLAEHGLGVEYVDTITGYNVELHRFEPSIALKMTKIEAFVKDIEQVIETAGIRVLAPIPDSGLIGFEVPLKERTFPTQKPKIDGFKTEIGFDVMGKVHSFDIREAPHMLISGSTGSGKSVFMNALIEQIVTIPNAEFTFLDPKMVELYRYASHGKYDSDPVEIMIRLEEIVDEMNLRYARMNESVSRNIEEHIAKGNKMNYQFIFLDEYGDLIAQKLKKKIKLGRGKNATSELINVSEKIRDSVLLISQKARAAGIHLIISTQRPSVNVIDGVIKANFPTRVAFKTATSVDSKVIIDQMGAEKLLGKGDMLFLDGTNSKLTRLQGFNI